MLQTATWDKVVQSVVDASGGRAAGGIQHEEAVLDPEQSELIDEWLRDLVMEQRREASRDGEAPGEGAGTRTEERKNNGAGDLHTGGFGGQTRAEL